MDGEFNKRAVLAYSNFMKYIIPFALYNIILTIIENSACIYSVDLMFSKDKILSDLLSPFYFLSPNIYLDILNEQFPNECDLIFNYNGTRDDGEEEEEEEEEEERRNLRYNRNLDEEDNNEELRMYQRFSTNKPYLDIKFRGKILYTFDNSYCVYSSKLIFISIAIVIIMGILCVSLFFLDTRGKPNLGIKIAAIILTNTVNIIIRPLFIFISVVLVNRPIVYLYKGEYIKSEYKTNEVIYMVLSLLVLIILYFLVIYIIVILIILSVLKLYLMILFNLV